MRKGINISHVSIENMGGRDQSQVKNKSLKKISPFRIGVPKSHNDDKDVPESWSGANSNASASQDRVQTTLLTTIGGRTLPNPVRVPDNMVHLAVLTSLMEGPVQPWQCLVWSEESPLRYSRALPDHHTSRPGSVLLQVGLSLIDVDGEYRGGGVVEEIEENEGEDASIDQ